MGEDRIHRRRVLADLLFLGGALTAAALLAQTGLSASTTEPPVQPHPAGTPVPPRPEIATHTKATPAPRPGHPQRPADPLPGDFQLPPKPAPAAKPKPAPGPCDEL